MVGPDVVDRPTAVPSGRAAVIGTTTPGTVGVATIGGHTGASGVFGRLAEVPIGSHVVVVDVSGQERRFIVRSIGVFVKGTVPEEYWGAVGEPVLVLISCTGPHRRDGLSRDNIVLYTTLA